MAKLNSLLNHNFLYIKTGSIDIFHNTLYGVGFALITEYDFNNIIVDGISMISSEGNSFRDRIVFFTKSLHSNYEYGVSVNYMLFTNN